MPEPCDAMPEPCDHFHPRVFDAEGAWNPQSPDTCWRCGSSPHVWGNVPCVTPTHLLGVLGDLERKHAESLSQIRKLVDAIEVPRCGDKQVPRQVMVLATPDQVDVIQTSTTTSAMSIVRSLREVRSTHSKIRSGSPKKGWTAQGLDAFSRVSLGNRKIETYLGGSDAAADVNTNSMCPWLAYKIRRLFEWKPLDYMIGIVILANTICLGMQAQFELEGHDPWLTGAEHAFLSIYCLELLLRIIGYGLGCLRNAWIAFDAILVFLGVSSEWVLQPVIASATPDNSIIKQLLVLRVLRLLRLLRAVRMMQNFRTAWRLAHGLLTSGNTIASVFGLLLLALYIFALAGVEIITKDQSLKSNPEVSSIIQQNFNSVPRFLLTLSQFVLADSVASIYRPLISAKPVLVLYFIPLMLIVSVALMNLVTAVIVEGALANASRDKEVENAAIKERARKLAPKFKDLFTLIDSDSSGIISIDEVNSLTIDDLPREVQDHVDPDSMVELIQVLDVDGSGDVSQEEFIHGMIGLCMSDVPKELLLTLKLTRVQMRATTNIHNRLNKLEDKVLRALRETAKRAGQDSRLASVYR